MDVFAQCPMKSEEDGIRFIKHFFGQRSCRSASQVLLFCSVLSSNLYCTALLREILKNIKLVPKGRGFNFILSWAIKYMHIDCLKVRGTD